MSDTELAARAAVFAALGDETRLALIGRLSASPSQSIARLAAGAAMTRQGISKHLHVLQGAGIVRGVRNGREARFELRAEKLAAARSYLEEVSAQWDEALARLKAFVER